MLTTFAQFKSELRLEIFPDGEASNHVAAHNRMFVEALCDLQVWCEPLQQNNTWIIPFCSSYFQCGMSVIEMPRGIIRRVSTYDKINESTALEDPTVGINWCSEVHYTEVQYIMLRKFVDKQLAYLNFPMGSFGCGCSSFLPVIASQVTNFIQFATACGKQPMSPYTQPDDSGYPGFPQLPVGFHYAQSITDLKRRARLGVFAKERGRLYIAPWIQSTEVIVVEWDGIKRDWAAGDLVDNDPFLVKAVMAYVTWQHWERYDDNPDIAESAKERWIEARADLIHNYREETRRRSRENSFAQGSNLTLESQSTQTLPTTSTSTTTAPTTPSTTSTTSTTTTVTTLSTTTTTSTTTTVTTTSTTTTSAAWTAYGPVKGWYGIAASSDGSIAIAVTNEAASPYISTDSGATWTAQNVASSVFPCAISSDGQKMYFVHNSSLYRSSDGGSTWASVALVTGETSLSGVACSADGATVITQGNNLSKIFTSKNSGASFVQTAYINAQAGPYGLAVNSDGTICYASITNSGNNGIYRSTDGGSTWAILTASNISQIRQAIACSADGNTLMGAGTAGAANLFYSINTGVTFPHQDAFGAVIHDADMSSDGSHVVFGTNGSDVKYSIDGGANYLNGPTLPNNGGVVAISGDGNVKFAASFFGSHIYVRVG